MTRSSILRTRRKWQETAPPTERPYAMEGECKRSELIQGRSADRLKPPRSRVEPGMRGHEGSSMVTIGLHRSNQHHANGPLLSAMWQMTTSSSPTSFLKRPSSTGVVTVLTRRALSYDQRHAVDVLAWCHLARS